MKRMVLFVLLSLAVLASSGNVSAGIVGGYPSALTLRLDLSEKNALDLTLGSNWSFLEVFCDYVIKTPFNKIEGLPLMMFYGPGIVVGMWSYETWDYDPYWRVVTKTDIYLGARAKVGWSYFFENSPFEIFIETGPGIYFVPVFEITWFGGCGIRYRF